jgi:hypothetical protein
MTMYHINKLWPREYHEAHTKNFAYRPWMCKDVHFNHRAEEVWQALFKYRDKNKGFFNFSLVLMVYVELKLGARWLKHVLNDNTISTPYWEDSKRYLKYV